MINQIFNFILNIINRIDTKVRREGLKGDYFTSDQEKIKQLLLKGEEQFKNSVFNEEKMKLVIQALLVFEKKVTMVNIEGNKSVR